MNVVTSAEVAVGGSTADRYRYEHPRLADILSDMYIPKSEPGPGAKVAPFDLQTTGGGRLNSNDLDRPTLLVFGSRTCPVTESAAEGLKELHSLHGKETRFVMVQAREAHPGQAIPQPQDMEEKLRHARDLKGHHHLPFEVAADDIDGSLHRTLGSRPNSAYLIDGSGTIVFRAQWANETRAIGDALSDLAAGRAQRAPAVTNTLRAIARAVGNMSPVLEAAGSGAKRDTWRIAPPMGILMTLSDAFFFLPRPKRGLAVMATMIAGVVAVTAALALLAS